MAIRLPAFGLAAALAFGLASVPALAAGDAKHPHDHDWSFEGVFGEWDYEALQRGYQVYQNVCKACHSMQYLHYRNLTQIGFSEDQVKAIAAQFEVEDGPDDEGQMFMRPAEPKDRFQSPFANEQEARYINNGALPPDLSLIVKARKYGPDYVYALLTGYEEPPEEMELALGMNYNPYFKGEQIAMAQPLYDDMVEYADGTPATIEQMSEDVTYFLSWAAEPHMIERKEMGVMVIIFLAIFSGILYAAKQQVWADVYAEKKKAKAAAKG